MKPVGGSRRHPLKMVNTDQVFQEVVFYPRPTMPLCPPAGQHICAVVPESYRDEISRSTEQLTRCFPTLRDVQSRVVTRKGWKAPDG
jgi:hypothetical protein